LLLLFECAGFNAAGAEEAIPAEVFGLYRHEFKVRIRDINPPCESDQDERCLALVYDELRVDRIGGARAKVSYRTNTDGGHGCEIEAEAQWFDRRLMIVDAGEDGRQAVCKISIEFGHGRVQRVEGSPASACQRFCGAGATLFSDDLVRVDK